MSEKTDRSVREVTFEESLRALLNRHSKEQNSNTPDFVLSQYLINCLDAFDSAMEKRSDFYSK
ncbi:hypothetical protein KAR91_46975 [Candidatus Pacearchaeota archaeon]|nr:hypothetical protein [Candidatus Pacearchaeota archaeon]